MVQLACRACRKVESTHFGVHAAIVMVLNIDCGVDMNPHTCSMGSHRSATAGGADFGNVN